MGLKAIASALPDTGTETVVACDILLLAIECASLQRAGHAVGPRMTSSTTAPLDRPTHPLRDRQTGNDSRPLKSRDDDHVNPALALPSELVSQGFFLDADGTQSCSLTCRTPNG